jgi:hypothetical protein
MKRIINAIKRYVKSPLRKKDCKLDLKDIKSDELL